VKIGGKKRIEVFLRLITTRAIPLHTTFLSLHRQNEKTRDYERKQKKHYEKNRQKSQDR
jgi:hypothetical protein